MPSSHILPSDLEQRQSKFAFRQRPQVLPPRDSTNNKQKVVRNRPNNTQLSVFISTGPVLAPFSFPITPLHRSGLPRSDPPPNTRQAHPIAEGMHNNNAQETSGPQI